MASILKKPPFARRSVATVTGAVLTNAGQIKIPLDMGMLIEEHIINVDMSQTWGTNPPTAFDPRKCFSKVELVSSQGTHVSADGYQFYDAMRVTESSSANVIAYGAGSGAAATASFSMDLHHIMDEAHQDLLTALRSADVSGLQLVLTCAADASSGFSGGSGTVGAAAYTVNVEEKSLPGLSGKTKQDRDAIGYGNATHRYMGIGEIIGGAAVTSQQFKLKTGNKTRFLVLHCHSVTGGVPANGIVDEISLTINGVDYYRNTKAVALQQDNTKHRGLNVTGLIVLDRGEDISQWFDLRNLNEVKLEVKTLATAPASWRVTCAQDYAEGLEKFGL